MKNILQTIVAAKKKEVEEKKSQFDLDWFKFFSIDFERKCISLKENLLKERSTGIIAEFKRRSPSKGWFKNTDCSAPEIVTGYEKFGAVGVSILSDTEFFGGGLHDITVCRAACEIPILQKDFIIDEIQLQEAKAYGADVILLIAAVLSPNRVEALALEAKKYGMEVLLELHEASEIDHICDAIDMVGVNNRDLKTFTVDINRSIALSKKIPSDKIKVAESGIDTVETIRIFREEGFKGFLIGEKFMKEDDPVGEFETFVQQLKQG